MAFRLSGGREVDPQFIIEIGLGSRKSTENVSSRGRGRILAIKKRTGLYN